MDVYMSLGLATASALAINGLKVNKALKLLAVTGVAFAIGWNGGVATAGAGDGASRAASWTRIDPSALLEELRRRIAKNAPSTASVGRHDARSDGAGDGAPQILAREAVDSDGADEIELAQLPNDRLASNP